MNGWKSIPFEIPSNGQEVNIRVKYYYGLPFLAVYSVANQNFVSSTGSIVYPAWTVSRWKATE